MLGLAILAAAAVDAAAPAPSSADLAFMVGEWRVTAEFNPGTDRALRETGKRSCDWVLDRQYVYCLAVLTSEKGRQRTLASYHNYNPLYGRYEDLWIASNWPTKVIGYADLTRGADGVVQNRTLSFSLPDGAVEHIRGALTFKDGRIVEDELLRTTRVGDTEWRLNYRLEAVRAP